MSGHQSLTIVVPATRGGNYTRIGIIDSGVTSVHVTAKAELLTTAANGCAASRADAIRITPDSFTLHSGERVETVVFIPSSTPAGDYAALYNGTVSGSGNVRVAGAVGALLRWHGAHAVSCVSRPQASVKPAAGGFPYAWLIVPLLLGAFIIIAVMAVRHHRKAVP